MLSSDEVFKFFGKGWAVFVVVGGSILLAMAVQYLYNAYSNRTSDYEPLVEPGASGPLEEPGAFSSDKHRAK